MANNSRKIECEALVVYRANLCVSVHLMAYYKNIVDISTTPNLNLDFFSDNHLKRNVIDFTLLLYNIRGAYNNINRHK
jgi:hypothetical protein